MRASRFSFVDLVGLVSLSALGLVLVMPAVARARAVARQNACSDHFKQMGIALHNYHSLFNTFPPGRIWEPDPTRPPHDNGVAVFILPFIEQNAVYNTFNFQIASWTSLQNKTTRIQRPELFLCPDDLKDTVTATTDPTGGPTNVAFSLGSQAWLTHPTHSSAGLGPKPEGVFFDNSKIGLREIVDGASSTVLASEQIIDAARREGSAEITGECSGAQTDGKQYFERSGSRWIAGHPSSNYFNARRRPNDPQPDCFHGTSPIGIGSLNKVPRSRHDGGVNVLLGDGAAKFIRNAIDLKVWQALNTRSGLEQIERGSF